MNPFEPVLIELRRAEGKLLELYEVAERMHARGVLTPGVRDKVHSLRDDLHTVERTTYTIITRAIDILSPVPGAVPIPEPQRWPDLPAANAAGLGATSSGGYVPIRQARSGLLWAGIVLAIVGVFFTSAAVLTVLGRALIGELGSVARHAISVRENTSRYLAQLKATEARYYACLDRGVSVAECVEQIPVPEAPQEAGEGGSAWWAWLLAGGLAVGAVGLGVWAYGEHKERGSSGGTSGLGGRRALRSGRTYNMEVE